MWLLSVTIDCSEKPGREWQRTTARLNKPKALPAAPTWYHTTHNLYKAPLHSTVLYTAHMWQLIFLCLHQPLKCYACIFVQIHILISSPMSPSGQLVQIWSNSLQPLLRYCTVENWKNKNWMNRSFIHQVSKHIQGICFLSFVQDSADIDNNNKEQVTEETVTPYHFIVYPSY